MFYFNNIKYKLIKLRRSFHCPIFASNKKYHKMKNIRIDYVPESWEEKLSSFKRGESRVYMCAKIKQINLANEAIQEANRAGYLYFMLIKKTRFCIKRIR